MPLQLRKVRLLKMMAAKTKVVELIYVWVCCSLISAMQTGSKKLEATCWKCDYSDTGLAFPHKLQCFHDMQMKGTKQITLDSVRFPLGKKVVDLINCSALHASVPQCILVTAEAIHYIWQPSLNSNR